MPLARPASLSSLAALLALAGLTGCQVGFQPHTDAGAMQGLAIHGHIHGGAFPIEGAKITLMETQSTGYNQPAKVLEQVMSDNNGYFTFDNNWTCDAGQYAYVVVSSGHTVVDNTKDNNNVLQVGVVGSCSDDLATVAEANNVNVWLSELSTVAAAYALGNFINISTDPQYGLLANITSPAANNSSSPGCTGSGATMACTQAGLAHAFTNAYNLVDSVRYDGSFPTGAARTAIPGNAQTIVPQSMIDSIGNILQACVDSTGVKKHGTITASANDGTPCGELFEYATPPGGAVPSNTLQVALNMAKYPNNNVAQLFALQPSQSFFTPTLSTTTISNTGAPMAFSISIFYEGTGLAHDPGLGTPVHIGLDANDNAYIVYTGSNGNGSYGAVDGLTAGGQGIFLGTPQSGLTSPNEIALDNVGYAWVTNDSANGGLYQIPVSGSNAGTAKAVLNIPNGYAGGVALDESNNVWVSRDSTDGNQSLYQFQYANGYNSNSFQQCFYIIIFPICTGTTPVLGAHTKRLFVDSKQNIFGVTASGSATAQFYEFPFGSNGTNTTLSTVALGSSNGFGLAMTSTDEAYLPIKGQLDTANGYTNNTFSTNANSEGSYSGASTTGSTYSNPGDTVIDGAGNVFWTDFESTGQLFDMDPNASGNVTNGTLTSVFPCLPENNQCYGTSSNLRGMAIDSSGAIWFVSDSSPGLAVQTLGLAANSWPLLSYAHAGLPVQ